MFVNCYCFYFSAIKDSWQLVICIFEGGISDLFIFLPKRRKPLVTFWERTAEKLRNTCNPLFTYPLPHHSSLTQHSTAILAFRYAMVPPLMIPPSGRGLYHQSLYRKDRYHNTMNYLWQSEDKSTHFTMCNSQNVSRKCTHNASMLAKKANKNRPGGAARSREVS